MEFPGSLKFPLLRKKTKTNRKLKQNTPTSKTSSSYFMVLPVLNIYINRAFFFKATPCDRKHAGHKSCFSSLIETEPLLIRYAGFCFAGYSERRAHIEEGSPCRQGWLHWMVFFPQNPLAAGRCSTWCSGRISKVSLWESHYQQSPETSERPCFLALKYMDRFSVPSHRCRESQGAGTDTKTALVTVEFP